MRPCVTLLCLDTEPNLMFFDINGTPYELIDNYQGDLIDFYVSNSIHHSIKNPISNLIPTKKNLVLDITHNTVNQLINRRTQSALENSDTWIISNAFSLDVQHPRLLYVDFLFNRTKAYYSQFPFLKSTKKWYYHGIHAYQDIQLTGADDKKKIFVAPCKTYKKNNGLRWYRYQLFTFLLDYVDRGYLGNHPDTDHILYAQAEFPWDRYSINDLENQHKKVDQDINYTWFDYIPPHNAYYQNTFLSVYTESIETGKSIAVTEKTYDPLLKGHFLLPFSCSGFVRYLKKLGILFPDFIDYSYDDIENDDQRYLCFQDELKRLLDLDLDTWKSHWESNYDLLYQNKLWFHNRDYDRIDLFSLLQ